MNSNQVAAVAVGDSEKEQFKRIQSRLETTTNDKLENVINSLLPKIIPMLVDSNQSSSLQPINSDKNNNDFLIPILNIAFERIQTIPDLKLPVKELLDLVSSSQPEIVSYEAIRFLDIGIMKLKTPSYTDEYINDCVHIILSCIKEFPTFHFKQSYSLLFYAYKFLSKCALLISTTTNTTSTSSSTATRIVDKTILEVEDLTILSDWLFDLTLLQTALVKDAVGSIIPGLSHDRIVRLTSKQTVWAPAEIKQFKLTLITSLGKPWLPTQYILPTLLSCLSSDDQDVKNEAVFKINGATSLYNIKTYCVDIFIVLINLCLPESLTTNTTTNDNTAATTNTRIYQHRTKLADKLKISFLEYIIKELVSVGEVKTVLINSTSCMALVRKWVAHECGCEFDEVSDATVNNNNNNSDQGLLMPMSMESEQNIATTSMSNNTTSSVSTTAAITSTANKMVSGLEVGLEGSALQYHSLVLKILYLLTSTSSSTTTNNSTTSTNTTAAIVSPTSRDTDSLLTLPQYILIIKRSLHSFISRNASLSEQDSLKTAVLRDSCYLILDTLVAGEIIRVHTDVEASAVGDGDDDNDAMTSFYEKHLIFLKMFDKDLVHILFKMLDMEGSTSNVHLHALLTHMKELYMCLKQKIRQHQHIANCNSTNTTTNSSKINTTSYDRFLNLWQVKTDQLKLLLSDVNKTCTQNKARLVLLEWIKSLFDWELFTVENMFLLCQQTSASSNSHNNNNNTKQNTTTTAPTATTNNSNSNNSTNNSNSSETVIKDYIRLEFTSLQFQLQSVNNTHNNTNIESIMSALIRTCQSNSFTATQATSSTATSNSNTSAGNNKKTMIHTGHVYIVHSLLVCLKQKLRPQQLLLSIQSSSNNNASRSNANINREYEYAGMSSLSSLLLFVVSNHHANNIITNASSNATTAATTTSSSDNIWATLLDILIAMTSFLNYIDVTTNDTTNDNNSCNVYINHSEFELLLTDSIQIVYIIMMYTIVYTTTTNTNNTIYQRQQVWSLFKNSVLPILQQILQTLYFEYIHTTTNSTTTISASATSTSTTTTAATRNDAVREYRYNHYSSRNNSNTNNNSTNNTYFNNLSEYSYRMLSTQISQIIAVTVYMSTTTHNNIDNNINNATTAGISVETDINYISLQVRSVTLSLQQQQGVIMNTTQNKTENISIAITRAISLLTLLSHLYCALTTASNSNTNSNNTVIITSSRLTDMCTQLHSLIWDKTVVPLVTVLLQSSTTTNNNSNKWSLEHLSLSHQQVFYKYILELLPLLLPSTHNNSNNNNSNNNEINTTEETQNIVSNTTTQPVSLLLQLSKCTQQLVAVPTTNSTTTATNILSNKEIVLSILYALLHSSTTPTPTNNIKIATNSMCWQYLMSDIVWKGVNNNNSNNNNNNNAIRRLADNTNSSITSTTDFTTAQLFRIAEIIVNLTLSTTTTNNNNNNNNNEEGMMTAAVYQTELENKLEFLCSNAVYTNNTSNNNVVNSVTTTAITAGKSATSAKTISVREKLMAFITLLVYSHSCLKMTIMTAFTPSTTSTTPSSSSSSYSDAISPVMKTKILHWIELYLQGLLCKDLLIQDICVTGLCYLFQTIKWLDMLSNSNTNNTVSSAASRSFKTNNASTSQNSSSSVYQRLSDKIAHEVILILTKDKKLPQPVGMTVAGEIHTTTTTNNNNNNNGTNNNANDPTHTATTHDPLLRAASLLSDELGVRFVSQAENRLNVTAAEANNNSSSSTPLINFGVFTTLAKLAKKVSKCYCYCAHAYGI